jgi:integrase
MRRRRNPQNMEAPYDRADCLTDYAYVSENEDVRVLLSLAAAHGAALAPGACFGEPTSESAYRVWRSLKRDYPHRGYVLWARTSSSGVVAAFERAVSHEANATGRTLTVFMHAKSDGAVIKVLEGRTVVGELSTRSVFLTAGETDAIAREWSQAGIPRATRRRRRNPQNMEARSDRVIRHLVDRCGMSRKDAVDAVGRQRGESSDRPALTPEGLALFERAVDRMDFRILPYKAIFKLLPRTGMRIGEMVTMTWDRIDPDRGVFIVVGKNSDIREVPVTQDAWRILDAYVTADDPLSRSPHWVFPRYRGPDHVSVSRAGAAMRALRHEEPRLKDLTPHVLRHTFATEKLRECVGSDTIRDIMGHRGKRVAMLYYHL